MKKLYAMAICIVLLLTAGCARSDDALEREVWTSEHGGAIKLAIVGPLTLMKESTEFSKGVELARDIYNADDSFKSTIEILTLDDQSSVIEGTLIAQDLAKRKDVLAVIGHWNTSVTIPTASIYDNAGLLSICPIVSSNELTEKGYQGFIRTIANNREVVDNIAAYAMENSLKKVAIYYESSAYGKELASLFESIASEYDVKVIDRISDVENDIEFDRVMNKWEALDYDAVFLASGMRYAGKTITRIRDVDEDVTILGTDALDMESFITTLGSSAENVMMITYDNPTVENHALEAFRASFKEKYEKEPDLWAIQGYDAVSMIAMAVEKTQSTSPKVIAEALKNEEWPLVMGSVTFTDKGELHEPTIYQKLVKNGQFVYYQREN